MQINCWHDGSRKNAAKDVVRLRRIPEARVAELRAAICRSRDSDGRDVLFVLERGFSSGGRARARLAVGIGVVVIMLTAVAAFVAPGAAMWFLGLGFVPAVVVVVGIAAVASSYDTGIELTAGGTLRAEGWSGIKELDLTRYARVTVASSRRRSDDTPIEG